MKIIVDRKKKNTFLLKAIKSDYKFIPQTLQIKISKSLPPTERVERWLNTVANIFVKKQTLTFQHRTSNTYH